MLLKSIVWDKVTEGTVLIFGATPIFYNTV